MKRLIVRGLAIVGIVTFSLCALMALLTAMWIFVGMLSGQWACVHVLAMMGIAAGFMMATAVCEAVWELSSKEEDP